MPRLTSLSGAQVAVFFDDPLGIVEFDEVADGIPQFRDVAVDATMDDLFLQRAIEPLGDAVGLGLGDEGVGRLDAPELDLVGEVVRQILGAVDLPPLTGSKCLVRETGHLGPSGGRPNGFASTLPQSRDQPCKGSSLVPVARQDLSKLIFTRTDRDQIHYKSDHQTRHDFIARREPCVCSPPSDCRSAFLCWHLASRSL